MRKEENSRDKTERRKQVADKNRVILIIGDQLTDFISTKEAYFFILTEKACKKILLEYVGLEMVYDNQPDIWKMGAFLSMTICLNPKRQPLKSGRKTLPTLNMVDKKFIQ